MVTFRHTTRIARTIQSRATSENLSAIAGRLLNMPLDKAARTLTARWLTMNGLKGIHRRAASMILSRMYRTDADKALVVAQSILSQLEIPVLGEQLLNNTGWVDLGVEVLALGCHKVSLVDVRQEELSGSYRVVELKAGRLQVIASADKVNQGHLIELKFTPRHFTK